MSRTPKCTSSDGYYEAKIQLRPKNQKVYSFLIQELQKKKVDIAKQVKLKEGMDIYISSNKFAVAFAKRFKKQFKGQVKTTRSLVGLDKRKGKRIHRLTVCLRMPENPKPL